MRWGKGGKKEGSLGARDNGRLSKRLGWAGRARVCFGRPREGGEPGIERRRLAVRFTCSAVWTKTTMMDCKIEMRVKPNALSTQC